MKTIRSSCYRNKIWYTNCYRRKKDLVIRVVLLIAFTWLISICFIRLFKILHQNIDQNSEYFEEELKLEQRVDSEENYVSLKVEVPHYKDLNQSARKLPGLGNPGEYGEPVTLNNLNQEEKRLVEDGWDKHAFNEYASNLVSVHRRLPDVRPRGCRNERYSRNLPKTSVIICFHNEAWSVLLRTIHSVLDRSPSHLLEEIILVDDFSDLPHLGKDLDDFIQSLDKVKILRAQRREGLIRARLMGVSSASAPVLTFLDSHCECAPGWLEPLLQRIHSNWRTVVCPVIDTIDDETFRYEFKESDELGIGGFNWDLDFDWRLLDEADIQGRINNWDPIRSPTMPGGIFSISKRFFNEVGQYDEGFEIWGGENLELSFKTWMCGGTLEMIPCSRVGHVFRKRSPYQLKADEDTFENNTMRLAEVWLDDYKHYFYRRIGKTPVSFLDVESRKELRKKLKCKSFQWYLNNVYPDQYIPENAVAEGEFRNMGQEGDACLEGPSKIQHHGESIAVAECHLGTDYQYFILTTDGEIRRDQACLEYSGEDISFFFCHEDEKNQVWLYDPDTQTLRHVFSEKCLEMTQYKKNVSMNECSGKPEQRWKLQNFDPSKITI